VVLAKRFQEPRIVATAGFVATYPFNTAVKFDEKKVKFGTVTIEVGAPNNCRNQNDALCACDMSCETKSVQNDCHPSV
jgi:hypothetical protein